MKMVGVLPLWLLKSRLLVRVLVRVRLGVLRSVVLIQLMCLMLRMLLRGMKLPKIIHRNWIVVRWKMTMCYHAWQGNKGAVTVLLVPTSQTQRIVLYGRGGF